MEQQTLKGKVAIITGASCGMGQTMAELFAEEGAAAVWTDASLPKKTPPAWTMLPSYIRT